MQRPNRGTSLLEAIGALIAVLLFLLGMAAFLVFLVVIFGLVLADAGLW